jgi:hypothetical protein
MKCEFAKETINIKHSTASFLRKGNTYPTDQHKSHKKTITMAPSALESLPYEIQTLMYCKVFEDSVVIVSRNCSNRDTHSALILPNPRSTFLVSKSIYQVARSALASSMTLKPLPDASLASVPVLLREFHFLLICNIAVWVNSIRHSDLLRFHSLETMVLHSDILLLVYWPDIDEVTKSKNLLSGGLDTKICQAVRIACLETDNWSQAFLSDRIAKPR